MRALRIILLVIAVFTLAPVEAQDTLPIAEFTDCRMALPDGWVEGQDVECGYLIVPEDRSDSDSPLIELAFAILYAPTDDIYPDPILYLAGGPGGNAITDLETWLEQPYRQDRDLILLDQRGTGYSLPSLNCPELEESNDGATQACRDRLIEAGVNLNAYNSAENAADVADLRIALGYEAWNLYGVSYGTRLALTVMRDHPDGVRSVVLDSVYPPEIRSWEEYGQNTADVFGRLFQACADDPGCNSAYPDLELYFYETIDALNVEPAPYIGIDPDTGNGVDLSTDGDTIVTRIFQLLYSSEDIPYLPWLMNELTYENYAALDDFESGAMFESGMRQSGQDEDVTDSEGMNLSVECQEEVAFLDEAVALNNVPAQPVGLYQNSIATIRSAFTDCRIWNVTSADPIEELPVVSNIPTLVTAGEFDPITPAIWAESAASYLANSFYFLFPAAGHGVVDLSWCSQKIMKAFLDNPTQEPDGSCIDETAVLEWILPE